MIEEILSLALQNDWATGVAVEMGITPLKVATPHQSTGVDSYTSSTAKAVPLLPLEKAFLCVFLDTPLAWLHLISQLLLTASPQGEALFLNNYT